MRESSLWMITYVRCNYCGYANNQNISEIHFRKIFFLWIECAIEALILTKRTSLFFMLKRRKYRKIKNPPSGGRKLFCLTTNA